jgi:uncharacterized protein YndB with AHSA1/START domain
MVLTHSLDRTVLISATRDTVFRFFTDNARWAAWWGAGSTIDPKPGGAVRIRYPDATEVAGEVVEISRPDRIVFTYGFVSGQPIPPGASQVTIELATQGDVTRLRLTHAFADGAVRDHHVQGWRYQLSLFGNLVANEVHANAADIVDRWFAAWSIVDERDRLAALSSIASDDVEFRDRFSMISGMADLIPHISAALRFMPGMALKRNGEVRHCQGTVLAEWVVVASDGQTRGSGTSVFVFGADGRIMSVVGFWR